MLTPFERLWLWWHSTVPHSRLRDHGTSVGGGVISCSCGAARLQKHRPQPSRRGRRH